MKKLLIGLVSGLFMVGMANANTIISTSDIDSINDVDHIGITLDSTSYLSIDVLAWELTGYDFFGNGADNDHLDSYIYLFDTSGSMISRNDDSSATFGDGSVHSRDSYLNVPSLSMGDYILAIGSYDLSEEGAWVGINTTSSTTGNYQVTFNSDANLSFTVVPEPVSSTLFIVGGATLGYRRFRKKFKK
jgi:hypothetical protein